MTISTITAGGICFISLFFLGINSLLPLFIKMVKLIARKRTNIAIRDDITASIIIPAYNEEFNIRQKIDSVWNAINRLEVEAEVIIGSDGSTDCTVEIALAYLKELGASNWTVVNFHNEGKCSTINKLVEIARGDLIISTDADIIVPSNAIEVIVDRFANDRNLGCLSCIPVLRSKSDGSQKTYWRLEDRIREEESSLGKLIVVTGWLYAYRKKVFEAIPRGVMADDLWIPLTTLLKGYECKQEKALQVYSETTDERTEVKRRKRVISGGMDVVRRLFPRLAWKPGILLLVLLHKMNRWAIPMWIGLFIVASTVMWPPILVAYAGGVVVGYLFFGKERFCQLTYSIVSPVMCFVEVMTKTDFARWEHTRKHESS